MKMNSFPLTKTKNVFCFNVKEEEEKGKEVIELDRVHNVLIIDRSGSMSGSIDELVDNLKIAIQEMREQDLLSLIWFSGTTQNEFVVRNKCLFQQDKDDIYKLIERLRSTVGLTCFSESFKLVNELIEDDSVVCKNFNILFFTDGYPVTPWSASEEMEKTLKEVEKMKDKVLAVNCIGYGFYYDVDFLKKVSELTTFGKYFHNKDVTEYLDVFRNIYEIAKTASLEKIIVEVNVDSEILFLSRNFTKLFDRNFCEINANNRKNQFFVIAESQPEITVNGEKVEIVETKPKYTTIENFAYAYASELFYKGKTDDAIEVIYELTKDKYYIDKMINAFTFPERDQIVQDLKKAVISSNFKKFRMLNHACPPNYLPSENQFCLFDLIKQLIETESYFVPSTDYKRIGKKTVDNFDVFTSNKETPYSPFSECVFNKEHANLSIRYVINGKVKINPKQAKQVGLPFTEVDSYKFRNQTIIKDGFKNCNRLRAYVKSELFTEEDAFEQLDITNNNIPEGYREVNFDISNLPVINKSYVKESNDLNLILQKSIKVNELGVKAKVLKSFIKEIKEERPAIEKKKLFEGLTIDQIEVLKEHGLTEDSCYQGVAREVIKSEDFYESRSLVFDVEGWSSLPKISDCIEKRNKINNGTASAKTKLSEKDLLVLKFYDEFIELGWNKPLKENLLVMEKELKITKKEIEKTNNELAILRTAKICTNGWWEGLLVENKRGRDYFIFEENNQKLVIKAERVKIYY